jgi:hypothetical protein
VPLWGTHEIIKVPERGGSILVKYTSTKSLFKFVNLQIIIILSFELVAYNFLPTTTSVCTIDTKFSTNDNKFSTIDSTHFSTILKTKFSS